MVEKYIEGEKIMGLLYLKMAEIWLPLIGLALLFIGIIVGVLFLNELAKERKPNRLYLRRKEIKRREALRRQAIKTFYEYL